MYDDFEKVEGACSEPENQVHLFHYRRELGILVASCPVISVSQRLQIEPRDDMTPEEQRDSFCWNCPLNPRSREETEIAPFI